jgi:hypothetical protein
VRPPTRAGAIGGEKGGPKGTGAQRVTRYEQNDKLMINGTVAQDGCLGPRRGNQQDRTPAHGGNFQKSFTAGGRMIINRESMF